MAPLPSQIVDAQIQADDQTVQESAIYTLTFSVTVPMEQNSCTIAIYLPYPDFNLVLTPITSVQGVGLFGLYGGQRSFQFEVSTNDNSIIISDACSQGFILPTSPATFYLYGLNNPEVSKLLDPISIKIWNSVNG